MTLKNIPLQEFLGKAQVSATSRLPWVHTSQAGRIYDMVRDKKILAMPCNVFKGEKLTYLFVGRPAYKYQLEKGQTPYYLLPVVFVIRFQSDPQLKRIFPFDSGAFHKKRLPNYITFFKQDMFELPAERASIGRVISAFFSTEKKYMKRKPRDFEAMEEEHTLTPRHAAIEAVNRVYHERSSEKFDDRAAAVELQLEADIELKPENLLGVVMPKPYADDAELLAAIKAITPYVETYSTQPLNITAYFSQIYDCVDRIYSRNGVRYE